MRPVNRTSTVSATLISASFAQTCQETLRTWSLSNITSSLASHSLLSHFRRVFFQHVFLHVFVFNWIRRIKSGRHFQTVCSSRRTVTLVFLSAAQCTLSSMRISRIRNTGMSAQFYHEFLWSFFSCHFVEIHSHGTIVCILSRLIKIKGTRNSDFFFWNRLSCSSSLEFTCRNQLQLQLKMFLFQ